MSCVRRWMSLWQHFRRSPALWSNCAWPPRLLLRRQPPLSEGKVKPVARTSPVGTPRRQPRRLPNDRAVRADRHSESRQERQERLRKPLVSQHRLLPSRVEYLLLRGSKRRRSRNVIHSRLERRGSPDYQSQLVPEKRGMEMQCPQGVLHPRELATRELPLSQRKQLQHRRHGRVRLSKHWRSQLPKRPNLIPQRKKRVMMMVTSWMSCLQIWVGSRRRHREHTSLQSFPLAEISRTLRRRPFRKRSCLGWRTTYLQT
mmetsp:Transcript_45891/g.109293  ORF Transcript_45891/g.109293 Transcript_45891/m.109293 type:complete len:258 (-) Transcript_45891:1049-1822(-)